MGSIRSSALDLTYVSLSAASVSPRVLLANFESRTALDRFAGIALVLTFVNASLQCHTKVRGVLSYCNKLT